MLINLTPHPIDVYPEGTTYEDLETAPHKTLWPSRKIDAIRLPEITCKEEDICIEEGNPTACIPVYKIHYAMTKLPEFRKGVYYIVPRLVADLVRRKDFVYPYELIRNQQHKVVGCTKLGRFT